MPSGVSQRRGGVSCATATGAKAILVKSGIADIFSSAVSGFVINERRRGRKARPHAPPAKA